MRRGASANRHPDPQQRLAQSFRVIMTCGLWSIIEPEIAVLCAYLPTLRRVLPNQVFIAQYSGKLGVNRSMSDPKSRHDLKNSSPKQLHGNGPVVVHTVPLEDYGEQLDNSKVKADTGQSLRIDGGTVYKNRNV